MIAFFDPARGAQLEEAVVQQGVTINVLVGRLNSLELELSRYKDVTARNIRLMENRINLLESEKRDVNVWDMSALRETSPSSLREAMEARRTTVTSTIPNPGQTYYYSRRGMDSSGNDWIIDKSEDADKANALFAAWAATPDSKVPDVDF